MVCDVAFRKGLFNDCTCTSVGIADSWISMSESGHPAKVFGSHYSTHRACLCWLWICAEHVLEVSLVSGDMQMMIDGWTLVEYLDQVNGCSYEVLDGCCFR